MAKQRTPQGHYNCCPTSQCVCDPDLQNTQQDQRQLGFWSIWHHSWDADSCWWGRNWEGKTTDRSRFQLRCDPIILGGELHSEPLYGKVDALYHSNYRGLELSHEAVGAGTTVIHPWDGAHQWDAIGLWAWWNYHSCHLCCSPAAGQLHCCKQTALLCLHWSWESVLSCVKGGPMVGLKEQNKVQLQQLCCSDHSMIHWICRTKERDETHLALLLQKLSIEDITSAFHSRRLGLYRHVQWVTTCINSITNFPIPGTRKQEKPMKSLSEWLALTRKTEMHGGLVFDIAWCYQPHKMGHGQHLNLWMDMDGWLLYHQLSMLIWPLALNAFW